MSEIVFFIISLIVFALLFYLAQKGKKLVERPPLSTDALLKIQQHLQQLPEEIRRFATKQEEMSERLDQLDEQGKIILGDLEKIDSVFNKYISKNRKEDKAMLQKLSDLHAVLSSLQNDLQEWQARPFSLPKEIPDEWRESLVAEIAEHLEREEGNLTSAIRLILSEKNYKECPSCGNAVNLREAHFCFQCGYQFE